MSLPGFFLSQRPDSVCTTTIDHVDTVCNCLSCATGVGPRTNPVPPVRCWYAVLSSVSSALSTCGCGWYTECQNATRRRHLVMDESQSVTTESIQDQGPVVFFWPMSAPDSDYGSPCMLDLCPAGLHCSRSQSVHRCQRQHESARRRHRLIVLCCMRRSLLQQALLTLIRALVLSLVLAGVSSHLLDRHQSVLNAAARLVFLARQSDHITPLLDTVAVMVSWHGHSLH